ncbi:DUF3558 domain-containing protein [Amycolatopsis sp. NPDC004625]|uniref:DUF3558 domain-containing protein n=1 Tax=Amycolatopsis sp. NPDC004625 TaxID=3154670 RepID=UPI0033B58C96
MRIAAITLTMGTLLAAVTSCTSGPPGPQRLSPELAADPIDLAGFAAAPCGLMSAQLLAQYYVTTPGTGQAGACRWTPGDARGLSYQATVDTTSGGVEALYQHRASIAGFEPTTVHSYPGIHRGASIGHCTTMIGVADNTLLAVTVDATDPALSAHTDPCAEADRFAGTIIGYQGHRAP